MKKLTFLICILSAFTSCSTNPSKENLGIEVVEKMEADNKQANMKAISGKDFKIEKDESNDVSVKLFVYISDTSNLKSINLFLMNKYNNDREKWYNVFYFNKKGIVNKYLKSIDDRNITNEEWEKKYSKYSEYCNVSFNPNSGEESFDYNN